MSTGGEMVPAARSGRSCLVDAAAWFVVVMVAMDVTPPTRLVLDRDLLGCRLGNPGELHPQDAVGVRRLGPIGVQAVAHAEASREGADRALPPGILIVAHAGLGVPLTADRHGLTDDADLEARAVRARAERLDRNIVVAAGEVDGLI